MLRKKLNIWENEENDKIEYKENEIVVKIIQWIRCIFVAITCTFHNMILITCKKNKVAF